MRYTNQHKALGVDKRTFAILGALYQASESAIRLSCIVVILPHIPRTSIALRLRQLQVRGLVQSFGTTRTQQWLLTDAGRGVLVGSPNVVTQMVSATDDILAFFKQFLHQAKGKRVQLLNSFSNEQNLSTAFSSESLQFLFLELERSCILFDGVAPESAIDVLTTFPSTIKKSIQRRPSVWYVCRDDLLAQPDSFLVCEDTVIVYNFHEPRILHITDSTFAETIKTLIKQFQSFGRQVDFANQIQPTLTTVGIK